MVKIKDLKIGHVIRVEFDQITRDLIRKYSKYGGFAKLASNFIHEDDDRAQKAGLKGVIAHGLFSYGFITKMLDDFIEQEKYGKIIKVGVEMRNPVRAGDTLITEAILKEISGKRLHFEIKQKTETKIHVEKEGKILIRFEAGQRNYVSEKDYSEGYIKTKEIDKGTLYFRERINSPGYAIVELFE